MPLVSGVKGQILDRIRSIVRERGISKAELARRAELTTDAVYRVTSGKGLTFDQVWSIARALGMSPVELLPLPEVDVRVPNPSGPDLSPEQLALLDAIAADDPSAIRVALDALLSERTLAEVREPPLTSDQERVFLALESAGQELVRIARAAQAGKGETD